MRYSQLGQDIDVLMVYKKGYYVEIGASDGIELSNTYLLELNGWKGICVEPIPARYDRLIKNRKNAICVNKAVYHTSDEEVVFTISNKYDLLSGVKDYLTTYRDHVLSDHTDILIGTKTLNDILDDAKAPLFIEYLSLDTEGTELEILKSVDLKKYKFGIIDVEHNFQEPRRSDIRKLLIDHGYVLKLENKWDDRYVCCK